VKNFCCDDPYLFKYCSNQIFQKSIPDNEVSGVIKFCHSELCKGHFSLKNTSAKILQCGFYWPTMYKDTHALCKTCENYQKVGFIRLVIIKHALVKELLILQMQNDNIKP